MSDIKSSIDGSEMTEYAYLAELMCIRQAKKKGFGLPAKCWTVKEWKIPYKRQLLAAQKLLKVYDYKIILKTLTNTRNAWINSMHFPGLVQLLRETQADEERKVEKLAQAIPVKVEESGDVKTFPDKGNNLLSRLD